MLNNEPCPHLVIDETKTRSPNPEARARERCRRYPSWRRRELNPCPESRSPYHLYMLLWPSYRQRVAEGHFLLRASRSVRT